MRRRTMVVGSLAAAMAGIRRAQAADPGITDTEIKWGQTAPYSGPASAYSIFGRVETAYMRMMNDRGGVHGRKINLISLDDGYNPSQTIQQIRRLVEEDEVFGIVSPIGTAPNVVARKYLNDKHVPHIFASSGIASFGDHAHFPWTIGWLPSFEIEGQIFTKYIKANKPDAKIAVLYQNDDLGKDYLKGIRRELGDRADLQLVAIQSYEVTDPTIDQQIVTLAGSNANTLINVSTPKFAAQSIRKMWDIGWKPTHLLTYISAAVAAVMRPAGTEKSIGIISTTYFKDPTDPQWAKDPEYLDWAAFMDNYLPGADKTDIFGVVSYMMAFSFVTLLEKCGRAITRESIMRQVANLDFRVPMLLPGVRLTTGPHDYYPLKTLQMQRFDGTSFVLFGDPHHGRSAPGTFN